MHGGDCYRNEVNMDFSINVNPLGIPEEIADAMQQSLTQAMVYPDPQCQALRQAIGGVYQRTQHVLSVAMGHLTCCLLLPVLLCQRRHSCRYRDFRAMPMP